MTVTTHPRVRPVPIPVTALDLLDRAEVGLIQASYASDAGERYIRAHLGALRAAAALLAARSAPSAPSRPRSVWQLLPGLAPELTEWAIFFAGSARQRAAIERGTGTITTREADDLLRQAHTFVAIIYDTLGQPRPLRPRGYLAPITPAGVPVSTRW